MAKTATTIILPPDLYRRVERVARTRHQPVDEVAAQVLAEHLPRDAEDLPAGYEDALRALEALDDDALWDIMLSVLPGAKQRRLHRLLDRKNAGRLSSKDQSVLTALRRETDLLMLRKAHAAVLLKRRGLPIPTAEEL